MRVKMGASELVELGRAKKRKTTVKVKAKGGALPPSLCFAAGRLIGAAEASLNHLEYELGAGTKPQEILESVSKVESSLIAIRMEFPLTKETLAPVQRKFDVKTVDKKSLKAAVREAYREIRDLRGKAQVGCNVSR